MRALVLTKLKELLSSEPSGTRVRVEFDPKKSKDRVNIIKDDSIPDFTREAREKLLNGGSGTRAPCAKTDAAPAGSEARDSAPEISETASAMSIRARTEVTNRIDYIRSLGPAALAYMQGKDPRRTLPGRVDDDTMGGIGMDPSAWMRQAHPGASSQGTHATVSAHKMAPTASAGKRSRTRPPPPRRALRAYATPRAPPRTTL